MEHGSPRTTQTCLDFPEPAEAASLRTVQHSLSGCQGSACIGRDWTKALASFHTHWRTNVLALAYMALEDLEAARRACALLAQACQPRQ